MRKSKLLSIFGATLLAGALSNIGNTAPIGKITNVYNKTPLTPKQKRARAKAKRGKAARKQMYANSK